MPDPTVEHLKHAATQLVATCLRVTPGERVVVVGDAESEPIAAAIEVAARAASAEVTGLRLDMLRSYSTNHTGERPHKVLPDGVRRAMLSAQASVFVASAPHAEQSMRDQLLHMAAASRARHVHMPGIDVVAFARGLCASADEITTAAERVLKTLEAGREVTCESAGGTRLVVRSSRKWVPRIPRVSPGEALTLPTGSILTCPDSVSGKFAATASVGEFFGEREGLLREPVVFDIVDGVVMNVTAPGCPDLVRDIETMLHVAPNSDRVGMVVIGANPGIGGPTGEVTVDQNRPGLHLVFGDPQAKTTGVTWSARTAFAACQAGGTVRVDGILLADEGKLSLS